MIETFQVYFNLFPPLFSLFFWGSFNEYYKVALAWLFLQTKLVKTTEIGTKISETDPEQQKPFPPEHPSSCYYEANTAVASLCVGEFFRCAIACCIKAFTRARVALVLVWVVDPVEKDAFLVAFSNASTLY